MSMADLPVLRALKDKLRFHETRQKVLAENVANADTPGYRGRDIKAPDFFRVAVEGDSRMSVAPVVTSPLHIATPAFLDTSAARPETQDGYEVTPDGNSISLEDQMMKVTQNQMDYQVASSLYTHSLGLIKTALGKK